MITAATINDLYNEALAADAAWMDAISETFPRERAGDVRYTSKADGEPGSRLRIAYDAYRAAVDAWRRSIA